MKIGIFGGCFNPPHKMHKNIALELIEKKYLDKVIYVPTGNRYNKKDLADVKDRYNMVKLMIKDNKNLEISDYEIKNTLTYTYQTLDYFKEKYQNDEIYFICGSDNLNEITTWNNYHYILNNYKIIVVKRNNDNLNNILNKINNKNILIANIKLASISSTNIRKDINNKNYEYLLNYVDKSVLEYIKDKKMYKME
jgi:nicotinate-nucleotide adenylyltransferase